MNLLEHYIVEVHSVNSINSFPDSSVFVDLTYNCYGCVKRATHIFFDMDHWKSVKEKGYFLA